jgi:hypothetical protein
MSSKEFAPFGFALASGKAGFFLSEKVVGTSGSSEIANISTSLEENTSRTRQARVANFSSQNELVVDNI